ncbi:ABC transporter ATP-binding protein [Jeotgalibacillus sp. S-D1]|uniref:ABC transporter ATP-binding protein n=1 Tax=Jeotgalibacillus sp. S-D1 TaxID=2552189 RepID=UPI00105A8B4C|nr:ABC transporter ATP-binding protein [Jeotgalibacillus sp. S-D1]TDL33040.1 ABC transporter ATP-binding protein [Jeotgalibacillus sp. S-D1]
MPKRLNSPVISFDRVSYRHSEELDPVVNNVSFAIHQGDGVLIAGPSGAGKSTITMLMNGILPANGSGVMEGSIHWFGTPASEWTSGAVSKHIGMMFQDPESQFCMTTVEEELAFGLENLHLPREEMKSRIISSLLQTGLAGYEKRVIQSLSGGQKQRVALACLLAMKTDILLLDEPFANIDPLSRLELIQCLAQLKRTLDLTIVVIDHDLNGWVEWMNRAILLDSEGSIQVNQPLKEALTQRYEVFDQLTIDLPLFIQLQQGQAGLTVNEQEWRKRITEEQVNRIRQKQDSVKHEISLSPPVIEVNNLSYSVKEHLILRDISLTIREGETVAFCGHNGAGKSTLALLIAGLFPDYEGTISLKGRPVEEYANQEIRSEIGYVFQNPEHQFVEHTVVDDVGFGLRVKKLDADMIKQRVQATLQKIGLSGYEDRHPLSLSQGQKRRLSVAGMTIDDLNILLLDEPTYGQDAHSMKNLVRMLKQRQMEGKTTLIVTHDMELVHRLADRTILLSNGEIKFQGTADAMWDLGEVFLKQHGLLLPPSVRLQQWIGGFQHVAAHH